MCARVADTNSILWQTNLCLKLSDVSFHPSTLQHLDTSPSCRRGPCFVAAHTLLLLATTSRNLCLRSFCKQLRHYFDTVNQNITLSNAQQGVLSRWRFFWYERSNSHSPARTTHVMEHSVSSWPFSSHLSNSTRSTSQICM